MEISKKFVATFCFRVYISIQALKGSPPWFTLLIILTTIQALASKNHRFSIHMAKFPKIGLHDLNFIDVAPSPTFVGCVLVAILKT
jgi:hypothetical protein